jgi:LPXTG-motif cell wall-anchored protein
MHSKTWIRLFATSAVVTAFAATALLAQPYDKRTYFTFSGPVAVPGVTLPAGKYMFRLADTSSRNVVQVLSADGTKPYSMFFVYRAERFDVPSKPEVRFMETGEGMPAAIRTWWYPGERSGYEFAYPKEQARRLAEGIRQPVLTARTEPPAESSTPAQADLSRVSPTGEEATVAADSVPPATAPAGRSLEGELASQSIAIAPATTQPEDQQARASLPKTASTTPLWLLGGLGLLAAAGLLRRLRTSRA